jgi:hypothetical protein
MVDMLFISLEQNALTPLLYLTIYSLSRMDIYIMMRRLNKTTPRNKMMKRKYRIGVEIKLETHELDEYLKTWLNSNPTRTLMSQAKLAFLAH